MLAKYNWDDGQWLQLGFLEEVRGCWLMFFSAGSLQLRWDQQSLVPSIEESWGPKGTRQTLSYHFFGLKQGPVLSWQEAEGVVYRSFNLLFCLSWSLWISLFKGEILELFLGWSLVFPVLNDLAVLFQKLVCGNIWAAPSQSYGKLGMLWHPAALSCLQPKSLPLGKQNFFSLNLTDREHHAISLR